MKSKEEIEQLAKKLCNIPVDLVIDEEERYYKNFQKYDGVVLGYTQCQEDMADKKYTEEDLRQAIEKAIYLKGGFDKEGFSFYKDDNEIKEDIINSLNKQD